jgi:hypothetical protein
MYGGVTGKAGDSLPMSIPFSRAPFARPLWWPAPLQRFSTTVEIRLLAAHGMQCPLDALGIARDDGEVGFTGWSGSERPCSQSLSVPRGILNRAANSSWVSARARRSVLISTGAVGVIDCIAT